MFDGALTFTDFSIAGLFTYFAIKEVINLVKIMRGGQGNTEQKMERQIADLWDWHNVRGRDGVPIWYIRESLETTLEKLTEVIAANTETLKDIARIIERLEVK